MAPYPSGALLRAPSVLFSTHHRPYAHKANLLQLKAPSQDLRRYHYQQQHQHAAHYAALLQSCTTENSVFSGYVAHDLIVKSSFDQTTFLQNLLIQIYSQCGYVEHACASFFHMNFPDQYSWRFMINCYAQQGNIDKAFQFFYHMQCVGMLPDVFVYVSVLSVCVGPSALAKGTHIHTCIVYRLSILDPVVGTALVNMYGKCGDLESAQRVFNSISNRDRVCWNSMIALYKQFGQNKEALNLLEQMLQSHVLPDEYTFTTIVTACTGDLALTKGRVLHDQIVRNGIESRVDVGNVLINMYVLGGCIPDAYKTFDNIDTQNVVSWTVMISGYLQHGFSMRALRLFDQMHWEGVFPDQVLLVSIFSSLDALEEGKRIHAQMIGAGVEIDAKVGNALLNMYINSGSIQDACFTFNQMSKRELVSWTTMMAAFAQHGQVNRALQLLEQVRVEGLEQDEVMFISILSACVDPSACLDGKRIHVCIISCGFDADVSIGNALLNMYKRCGSIEESLILFARMDNQNDVTFISMLSVCADQAALQEGKWLHSCVAESGSDVYDMLKNALLTMYGRCGSLADAQAIFNKTRARNLALWNAMIEVYAQNGHGKDALELFSQIGYEKVTPSEATFVSVLSACSHSGLVDEAYAYVVSMSCDYGIIVEGDHYNCMVDLLGRVGRLDEAEIIILNMPCRPTSVSWLTLLSACREHVDVIRGENAAEWASVLDCKNTAPYIILSNLYFVVGREEDSARVIQRMREMELESSIFGNTIGAKDSLLS